MPDPVEHRRLFIAFELPIHIKNKLAPIQEELKKSQANAKWVQPHNCHLTVKFLGNTPIEKTNQIKEKLKELFNNTKVLSARLDKVGFFGSKKTPRIIFAKVATDEKILKQLITKLDSALKQLGFDKEKRPFRAHVTLARLRTNHNASDLLKQIDIVNELNTTEKFDIDNITLFESKLAPTDPIYTIIYQEKFSK